MQEFNPVVYSAVRGNIPQAAILLWRPTGALGRRIVAHSPAGNIYAHAGMAVWRRGDKSFARVESIDTQYGRGGDIRLLSEDVTRYPGAIDVYEVVARGFSCDRSGNRMAGILRLRYGYGTLLRLAVAQVLPDVFTLTDERVEELGTVGPMVCSQAVAWALRAGRVDPLKMPGQSQALVTLPWHLTHPKLSEYRFTLYATPEQVMEAADQYINLKGGVPLPE